MDLTEFTFFNNGVIRKSLILFKDGAFVCWNPATAPDVKPGAEDRRPLRPEDLGAQGWYSP
jgi:hypothetical protein